MRINRSVKRILKSGLIDELIPELKIRDSLKTKHSSELNCELEPELEPELIQELIQELEKRINNFSSDEFFSIVNFTMFNFTVKYNVVIFGLDYVIITHEESRKNKIIDIILKEEYEELRGRNA